MLNAVVRCFKGKLGKASDAVRENFRFRKDPSTVIRAKAVAAGTERSLAVMQVHYQYYYVAEFPGAQTTGGKTSVCLGRLCDHDGWYASLTRDELMEVQLITREAAYHSCDTVTRRTGRLAKQVILYDVSGKTLSELSDKRLTSIYGEAADLASMYYPQLQEKTCIVNAPGWLAGLVRMLKAILPARAMGKIELFKSPDAMWKSKWARKTLRRTSCPALFGGSARDPPGADGSGMATDGGPADTEIVVAARSQADIEIAAPVAGVPVSFVAVILSHDVELLARLVPATATAATEQAKRGGLLGATKVRFEDGCFRRRWIPQVPGKIVVTFNNSRSLLRSKTVRWGHGEKAGGPALLFPVSKAKTLAQA